MLTKLKENSIQAAGLSRVWQHIQQSAAGTISASRQYYTAMWADPVMKPLLDEFGGDTDSIKDHLKRTKDEETQKLMESYLIPYKEKIIRHRKLEAVITQSKTNCIRIIGSYKEGGGKAVKELSFLVWCEPEKQLNLFNNLIKWGQMFEQDSITFAKHGERFYEYATSPKPIDRFKVAPGTAISKFKGERYGSLQYTDDDGKEQIQDVYSQIRGRPFYWTGWEPVSKIQDKTLGGNITSARWTNYYLNTLSALDADVTLHETDNDMLRAVKNQFNRDIGNGIPL